MPQRGGNEMRRKTDETYDLDAARNPEGHHSGYLSAYSGSFDMAASSSCATEIPLEGLT